MSSVSTMTWRRRGHNVRTRRIRIALVLALALLSILGWLFLWPIGTGNIVSRPQPAADYAAALQRVAALQAQDGTDLFSECGTRLLTHGQRVERAIVLLHGFTSCPQQFATLGQQLHERGYNVLIPRLPYHGNSDRMAQTPGRLTAIDLARLADESVDIALGLGERVTVVGLSGGGTMAAWLGQERAEVDKAVIIAPALGIAAVPPILTTPVLNAIPRLPSFFPWWDGDLKDKVPGPRYSSPIYSSRAIGEFFRVGVATRRVAGQAPPGVKRLVVVTNAADAAVSNPATESLVDAWEEHAAREMTLYIFPADPLLPHDLIDPDHNSRTDLVYPILLDLIAR